MSVTIIETVQLREKYESYVTANEAMLAFNPGYQKALAKKKGTPEMTVRKRELGNALSEAYVTLRAAVFLADLLPQADWHNQKAVLDAARKALK